MHVPFSLGSMSEPYVYIHCRGMYLGPCLWYSVLGKGMMLVLNLSGVTFEVVSHNFVNLTLCPMGVL